MTGFGAATRDVEGVRFSVELRSLNNRYFKPVLRLPEPIAGLEAELESRLRRRIARGSVTLTVKLRDATARAAQEVNDAALLAYLEHLETLHEKVPADQQVHIDLTELMTLPGVLQPADDPEDLVERARPILAELTDRACDRLDEMRRAEGDALADDLRSHLAVIGEHLETIRAIAPDVVEDYHQRLRARVQELLDRAELNVAEPDLVREVAVFAEKSDIAEELARLGGHLEQFTETLDGDGSEPAGRTLEFIGQEMLRESNTIASKAGDRRISRAVVEIKGAIDRIKEQAANAQ